MKSLIKYSAICACAVLCATSLTSCPGAKVARAVSKSSGKAAPRSYNYGAMGGAAARGYNSYNRQQNERERYNTNYGGGYNSSYGGGYGGGYSNYGY